MNADSFNNVLGSDPDIAYSRSTYEAIKSNRAQLGGELFIDKLFSHIKLKPALEIYPPRSHKELRVLYSAIVASSRPLHDLHSLIYYILKDLKLRSKDAQQFAAKVSLPNQYRLFMDGLWLLDRLKFEGAVECLTEPSLIPTFPEDILATLLKQNSKDLGLALGYYHATEPQITTVETLDSLVDAMCQASLPEAFFASRAYEGKRRHHFFKQILSYVYSSCPEDRRAQLSVEFVSLPLCEIEEQWLQEYMLQGKGKNLHGGIDTMIMRRIVKGQTDEAAHLAETIKTYKSDGLNWSTLTQRLKP